MAQSKTQDKRAFVIGQESVRRNLAESLQAGRAAHAYLFSGPSGVGKTGIALEFARLLLCDRDEEKACDRCDQCSISANLQHPDLKMCFPLPKKSGSSEDEEREFSAVISKVVGGLAKDWYGPTRPDGAKEIRLGFVRAVLRAASLKPFQARRKVILILEAEKMNEEAQNALLKALEEPYPDSYFLLVSDNATLLRPTIRSRCQQVRVGPLPRDAIHDTLIAEDVPSQQAELSARLSGGSFKHALDLAGPEIEDMQKNVLEFLRVCAKCNPIDLPKSVSNLLDDGSLPEYSGVEMLGLFLRDAALSPAGADGKSDSDLAFGNMGETIQKFASAYPEADYEAAVSAVDQSMQYLRRGYTKEMALYALAIKLNHALGTMVSSKRTQATTQHD